MSSSRHPLNLTEWLALIALGIGIGFRLTSLGQRELWYDEVLSLLLSTGQRLSYHTPDPVPVSLASYSALLHLSAETGLADGILTLKRLLQGLVATEPHPPLFYLSQHLWLRLWGSGETALRSLNGLLSLVTLAIAYGLGRHLGNRQTGLILAALLALNPFFLFHSLNLRMYAPVVFWVMLASLAYSHCLPLGGRPPADGWWELGLVVAVAGGLLTTYLMVYWMLGCGLVALWLDRRRLWRHGLRFGLGIALTLPWMWWGFRQQLRNIDLDRFSTDLTGLGGLLHQVQGAIQTLGIHLIVGDWAEVLPPVVITLSGVVAGLGLGLASAYLLRQRDYPRLVLVWGLGLVPFAFALGADILLHKSTLPWGLGRSVIFALPGLLLLLALAIDALPQRLRPGILAGWLILYLLLSGSDLALRHRTTFRTVQALVNQSPATSTLVLLNSNAWGHVLRAAYYLQPAGADKSNSSPGPVLDLLAVPPQEMTMAVTDLLSQFHPPYQHLIWLQAQRPLWGTLPSPAQKAALVTATDQLITRQFQAVNQQQLRGTMALDNFTVREYSSP